jgi:hypothetical protein
MLLIQKVNSMRQYIGAVRAKNSILSPLCLFVETMPIKKAVASGNGNTILTQKLHVKKMQITLDHHNARQKLNYWLLPDPPNFSLPSTFNGPFRHYR